MSENTGSALRPLLLTYGDAALLLGLRNAKGEPNKKAIQILVRDGKLPVVFLSSYTRRIPYAACEEYVARLTAEAKKKDVA